MYLQHYIPALMAIILSVGFTGVMLGLAVGLGPRRLAAAKLEPFECGSEPIGSPRQPFSVKFYQVAILFLVFDIEAAFMYPWVVRVRALSITPTGISWFGFVEMALFIVILIVALAYVWRKKAIGWD